MKKKLLFIAFIFVLVFPVYLFAQDASARIAAKGEEAWKNYISDLKKNGLFIEGVTAKQIVANFSKYKGKYMIFPKVDFYKTFVDKYNKKYYYCTETGFDDFVIEYNRQIGDKLRKYSYIVGGLTGGEWELVGKIEDAFEWWGNFVFMKISAFRIKGKIAAFVKDGEIEFVGEEILEEELKKMAKDSDKDIPKNLKAIPKGLDPLVVAKLFFYVSSVEKNRKVWEQLLSKSCYEIGGRPRGRVRSWWRSLTAKGRSYFYVRTETDQENKKKYFFQIMKGEEKVGNPKPITVIKQNGEWKVDSANP